MAGTMMGALDLVGKYDDFAKGLLGSLTPMIEKAVGTTLSSVAQEAQATERERTLFEAGGKSKEQLLKIEETSITIRELNPDIKKDQAYSLMAKAELVHASNGLKYAEKASMLKYTTRFTEDDIMKMMSSIEISTGNESTVRQSNAVQYLSNKGGGAATGKFVESLAHFNLQNGNLLNTPEKMAATFVSIGNLLNDFKTYGALYENAMKMSGNGDLAAILEKHYKAQNKKDAKAKAAQDIATLNRSLATGEKETINIALGKLLMTFSSIKDQTLQQRAFDTLTGDAGDDMAKGLREVNDTATGDFVPEMGKESAYKVGNEAVNAHQLSAQNDAYYKTGQAQAMARNEAMEIATLYAEQMSEINTGISKAAEGVMGSFNSLNESIKSTTIFVGGVLILGSALYHIISQLRKIKDLRTTKEKFPQEETGGKDCCCCCDGTQSPSSKKKSKKKNSPDRPPTGEKSASNSGGPQGQAGKTTSRGQNNAPTTSTAGKKQPDAGGGNPQKEAEKTDGKNKNQNSAPTTSSAAGNQPGPDSGGNHAETGKAASGGWKKMLKGGLRRVPLLGTLLGVTAIAGSANKLDTAAQVGAEALGGWGGAAAGAATGAVIGSVLPGIGTAIGGIVGGLIGGMGGSTAGGALYDGIKSWWQNKTPEASAGAAAMKPAIQAGPAAPNHSPVGNSPGNPQPVSIAIPQVSIPLHVQGVLQDIPTMLKMLSDPSVAQRIKDIIERSLLDAIETRGGVTK
ncbi:hypothetical protein BBR47_50950 [Brevibacillus brevis NBRC 100599]|uniref:Phage tail tape measure protein n=1 Tax=Brevibacillus brevis (strain 47 / JCM 6285 / NBRC 100599) TaxID=358681 RepID=C0Z5G6_BREBN|nr:hypothetical protein [Brevibacillus brevis]BAH46072.1 hypothetical protein BBR47_50950 [Brevibacillus brevis NBRC 100599]